MEISTQEIRRLAERMRLHLTEEEVYAYAEDLALSVINAKSALVRVANIKYLHEVQR